MFVALSTLQVGKLVIAVVEAGSRWGGWFGRGGVVGLHSKPRVAALFGELLEGGTCCSWFVHHSGCRSSTYQYKLVAGGKMLEDSGFKLWKGG